MTMSCKVIVLSHCQNVFPVSEKLRSLHSCHSPSASKKDIIPTYPQTQAHACAHCTHTHLDTHTQPLKRTAIVGLDWPSGLPGFFPVGRWTAVFLFIYLFIFLLRLALVTMITLQSRGGRHASARPSAVAILDSCFFSSSFMGPWRRLGPGAAALVALLILTTGLQTYTKLRFSKGHYFKAGAMKNLNISICYLPGHDQWSIRFNCRIKFWFPYVMVTSQQAYSFWEHISRVNVS